MKFIEISGVIEEGEGTTDLRMKKKESRKSAKNAQSALRVKFFVFLRLFTYQLLHMNTKGKDTSFGLGIKNEAVS